MVSDLAPYTGFLAQGALMTLEVCVLALIGAVVVGTAIAVMRASANPLVRGVATVYVDIFRNIPFIVQLFFFYYGLPELGIYVDAFITGVIALSIAGGAFASDVIRAGILAIDPGIIEAGQVYGLSKRTLLLKIVMPIALRMSVRPLGSVLINLVLTSSILSTITLNELTGNAKIVASDTFRPFEVYFVLLLVYAAMTYLLSIGIVFVHRRLNRGVLEVD